MYTGVGLGSGRRPRVAGAVAVVACLLTCACTGGSSVDGHASVSEAVSPTSSKPLGAPAATPMKTVTVAATTGAPAPRPTVPFSGRALLLRALQAATPVDPSPYMGAHPNVYFQTPSGNVGCYIFIENGNRVLCQIAHYDFDQPGPDCPLGAVVQIDQNSSPSYAGCATEQLYADPTDNLPYGSSIRNGGLECASASSGVTCADASSGSGFFLSRQRFTPVQ